MPRKEGQKRKLLVLLEILAQFLIAVSLTKEEIRKHLMINPSTN